MKYLLSVLLCTTSLQSFAFSECVREVNKVWSSLTENQSVYVTFSDGGSSISKSEKMITEGQMNRFFSMALAAKVSGKKLRVRYVEDDLQCPPPSGTSRNDALGIWLVD